MKRPFLPASLVLLLALAPMRMINQPVKDADFKLQGFNSPVLQAEFHRTAEDVYALYGAENNADRLNRTQAIRTAHWYDNIFLVVYALAFALFAWAGFRLTRKKYFLGLIALAILAAFADWMENSAIIGITRTLDSESADFGPALTRLEFFTWLKWLSLGVYIGLLTRFFHVAIEWGKIAGWAARLLAWACVFALVFTLFAFITRSAWWERWMAQGISLVFFGLFLFGLFFRRNAV